jgi:hypothetical protein
MSSSIHLSGWISDTVSKWKNNGTKLQPGVSLDAIVDLEKMIQFRFPREFKEFYQQANGCEYLEMTGSYYSLWSLERILEEHKNSDNNYVGICDYLINSYSFGFFQNENGIFQEFNRFNVTAESFKEFVELIDIDSHRLY